MNNQQAYNLWAEQYDTNRNLTRDLEGRVLRETLTKFSFSNVLEIGCGTGKNSEWLITKAESVTAVDFSEEMLAKAKAKITSPTIEFKQADITKEWNFTTGKFDLISFSLVLEHIQNLHFIFEQASKKITPGGHLYIGELHPYKQYAGSVARFEIGSETVKLQCYPHNISEFFKQASAFNFSLIELNELFDEEGESSVPRILTLVFKAV
jgi:2-polyprenyl-3-methyl-5-hydroxy-6-metoxy-1,4-benzoquinol methylase